jgi:hypothetical protein
MYRIKTKYCTGCGRHGSQQCPRDMQGVLLEAKDDRDIKNNYTATGLHGIRCKFIDMSQNGMEHSCIFIKEDLEEIEVINL